MGVPARTAVEAPEGGRAPIWRAAACRSVAQTAYTRLRYVSKRQRLLMLRGNGWHCAFRRFASLYLQGASLFGAWS